MNMVRKLYLTSILGIIGIGVQAQNSSLMWENPDARHIIERLDIKSGSETKLNFTSLRPYFRRDAANFVSHADSLGFTLSDGDREDINYLKRDNDEYVNDPEASKNPLFNFFYKRPAHLFNFKQKYFQFSIDPGFYFRLDRETHAPSGTLYDNRRAIMFRGNIDDKVYFDLDVIESQTRFPSYIMDMIKAREAVPGGSYFKEYDSRITSATFDGYDYLTSRGLIGFNISKHIGMEFGHGKNFIGDGYRSLILSDVGTDYLFMKINTRVWKFHYQNIFAELNSDYKRGADQRLPAKYFAAHYLTFDISKTLNVGAFENVVFSRRSGTMEFQYLNPVIFYRTVEHAIGSPDNVLLGATFKWNLLQRLQLYGQFVLDDYNFGQRNGWWGNKYGIQLGAKYVDMFGVDHLDGQIEYNMVRPYTYTEKDSTTDYTHYNQPLAHPMGANFQEVVGILRYQPTQKFILQAKLVLATTGLDTLNSNWGSNIFLPNVTRMNDHGNFVGQGVHATNTMLEFRASYMLLHNLYIDFDFMWRSLNAAIPALSHKTTWFGLGFRLNMAARSYDY